MTGGMAFIYDSDENFIKQVNPETLEIFRIQHPHWENVLRELITEHALATESVLAARLLNQWNTAITKFWQVVPNEIMPVLEVPIEPDQEVPQTA